MSGQPNGGTAAEKTVLIIGAGEVHIDLPVPYTLLIPRQDVQV